MAATPEKGVANPRLEAFKEIEEARITQIKAEITEGGGNADDMDETPIPVEDVVEEPEVVAEEPVVEPVVEPKKYTLKVDGEEIEVDEAAVIEAGRKTLQKESAADKRLEEASRIKKSVEEEAARIQQMIKDQQQLPAPSADAPEGDDLYGQVAQAIQYGSESEAKEALKNLVKQAATKGQPQELTLNQVQDFLEFRDATAWLNDEYKDVVGDPILKGAFEKQEREMRTAGDARPYRQIYTEIGENLRGWLKGKTPEPPVAETKLERKAKVVTIPSASARQVAPDQPQEPTPSQLVEGMRKARKQF